MYNSMTLESMQKFSRIRRGFKDSTHSLFPTQAQDFHRSLLGLQGASAELEAQRLRGEVEREQLNVKAALQALEAEKARMAARAAAEKKRLLEKVRTGTHSTGPTMELY